MSQKIAICCVAYNRANSLLRLLTSLNAAQYGRSVPLIISIDKSDTDEVEKTAESFIWKFGEKRVIKHNKNLGLKRHIMSCGALLDEFDAIIVLEDDLYVAPAFFQYVEQCVMRYWADDRIAGISLYSWALNSHNYFPFIPLKTDSDVYLMQLAQSWGQVWMKNQWKQFVSWCHSPKCLFGKTEHLPRSICHWGENSWLKLHIKYCIEECKYFVYPYHSFSTNYSAVGTHNKKQLNNYFQVPLLMSLQESFNLNPTVVYDGFFENELLYNKLNMDKTSLCIDLYGNKGNREKRRFWLTTRKLRYRIIKSYGLQLRPIEANILYDIKGSIVFLYDTNENSKRYSVGNSSLIDYLYNYGTLCTHIKRTIKYLMGYKYI